jgi:tRNA pseudouridine55 synthase
MIGLLNINKPTGKTSRDVVNHVQRLVRPAKVGHAGTLDPLATGVLVVCVGPATRLIQYVQQMPKRYRATFLLGCRSDSDDTELEVTPVDAPAATRSAIETALPNFVGTIQQRPPAFSAIKVKGKRAYDLARNGEQIQLEARPITIHGIDIVSYDYPELVLDIRCGSGTYIRSIGRDLAEQLGTAAVMSALERTEIGRFRATDAATLDS